MSPPVPDMNGLLGCARSLAATLSQPLPTDLDLHKELAQILHGPRQLWRSATQGALSQTQVAALVVAHLEMWLVARSGPGQPRVAEIVRFVRPVRAALFGV
jgi:hypothetical protein